jgi:hypothetical protein
VDRVSIDVLYVLKNTEYTVVCMLSTDKADRNSQLVKLEINYKVDKFHLAGTLEREKLSKMLMLYTNMLNKNYK